jgi:hypothetical protein
MFSSSLVITYQRDRRRQFFHFNIQWSAGDINSYHRYAIESIQPFLVYLDRNPEIRLAFEIAGSGVEFLAKHYPVAVRLLRSLIGRGQVELISSLYTPAIWVAFPRRDLRAGALLNRRYLETLGLAPSRVFFSQEAFFGEGVAELADLFDIAVCKDEYLDYFYDIDLTHPLFRLGR